MPRGVRLSDAQKREMYELHCNGESNADIATTYGILPTSVSRIIGQQRDIAGGRREFSKECVIGGNKRDGRLVSTKDPHRYEGTCVIRGKSNSKSFEATNGVEAKRMWREWCDELRREDADNERAFMDMVERKEPPKEPAKETHGESVYVIWAKGDAPKLYGAYRTMDEALAEVDRLNEVASFLTGSDTFEVEEVPYR